MPNTNGNRLVVVFPYTKEALERNFGKLPIKKQKTVLIFRHKEQQPSASLHHKVDLTQKICNGFLNDEDSILINENKLGSPQSFVITASKREELEIESPRSGIIRLSRLILERDYTSKKEKEAWETFCLNNIERMQLKYLAHGAITINLKKTFPIYHNNGACSWDVASEFLLAQYSIAPTEEMILALGNAISDFRFENGFDGWDNEDFRVVPMTINVGEQCYSFYCRYNVDANQFARTLCLQHDIEITEEHINNLAQSVHDARNEDDLKSWESHLFEARIDVNERHFTYSRYCEKPADVADEFCVQRGIMHTKEVIDTVTKAVDDARVYDFQNNEEFRIFWALKQDLGLRHIMSSLAEKIQSHYRFILCRTSITDDLDDALGVPYRANLSYTTHVPSDCFNCSNEINKYCLRLVAPGDEESDAEDTFCIPCLMHTFNGDALMTSVPDGLRVSDNRISPYQEDHPKVPPKFSINLPQGIDHFAGRLSSFIIPSQALDWIEREALRQWKNFVTRKMMFGTADNKSLNLKSGAACQYDHISCFGPDVLDDGHPVSILKISDVTTTDAASSVVKLKPLHDLMASVYIKSETT